MGRTIAIGDIHGYLAPLVALIQAISPRPEDKIVLLGDYVDHGPDSKGVINKLILLSSRCRLIAILGNHEEMMLQAPHVNPDMWLNNGGFATLESYDIADDLEGLPDRHRNFLEALLPYHETATHFFVHANYLSELPLECTSSHITLWRPLDHVPAKHCSGKIAVLGHTPQKANRVLDAGHLMCIDTGCGYGGVLTAVDVDTGKFWQANQSGGLL